MIDGYALVRWAASGSTTYRLKWTQAHYVQVVRGNLAPTTVCHIEVNPERIRLDFYDVLNTRENGQNFTPPAEGEIVLGHSWCGTREEIGRPEFDASLCL